ncbi:GlsB/YeaQ/YmgE family stress response membrane protein [Prosthecobacter sp.]|uniref:GlsB/YeaQ/YmgE family stress response membrane protein n=1 Tax=Prosthecobacter sp. TaxID=1965333 RepID=UPI0024887316|nr:GlsB/YeaQ/YmgE family stress response membrane protein [Prosthecobacter sp.]MDI1311176.1 GlsB/YeaQ/YmgE family stress response membrane protein [Prosthecobacter sp.]
MSLQGILIWSALGLVAGILAKLIMPGRQGINPITTVLLGIIGSIIGGYLGHKLGYTDMTGSFSVKGIGTAVAGAVILMTVWRLLFGKKG